MTGVDKEGAVMLSHDGIIRGRPLLQVVTQCPILFCERSRFVGIVPQRLRLCPHFVVIDNSQDCFCNSPLAERTS